MFGTVDSSAQVSILHVETANAGVLSQIAFFCFQYLFETVVHTAAGEKYPLQNSRQIQTALSCYSFCKYRKADVDGMLHKTAHPPLQTYRKAFLQADLPMTYSRKQVACRLPGKHGKYLPARFYGHPTGFL